MPKERLQKLQSVTARRDALRQEIRNAIRDGDEKRVEEFVDDLERDPKLYPDYGDGIIKDISAFLLGRLNFSKRKDLSRAVLASIKEGADKGDMNIVQSPWGFYAPLIAGIAISPLATVELDAITEGLLVNLKIPCWDCRASRSL